MCAVRVGAALSMHDQQAEKLPKCQRLAGWLKLGRQSILVMCAKEMYLIIQIKLKIWSRCACVCMSVCEASRAGLLPFPSWAAPYAESTPLMSSFLAKLHKCYTSTNSFMQSLAPVLGGRVEMGVQVLNAASHTIIKLSPLSRPLAMAFAQQFPKTSSSTFRCFQQALTQHMKNLHGYKSAFPLILWHVSAANHILAIHNARQHQL